MSSDSSSRSLFSKWTECDRRGSSPCSSPGSCAESIVFFSVSTTWRSFLTASIDSWGGFAWWILPPPLTPMYGLCVIFSSDGDSMDFRRRLPPLLFRLNPDIVVLEAERPSSSTIRAEDDDVGDDASSSFLLGLGDVSEGRDRDE